MRQRWLLVVVLGLIGNAHRFLSSQTIHNHDYPRLGIFVWNTHAPASWFAKFDLIITSNNGSSFPRAVKALNPNTYILYTRDINAGQGADPYYSTWTVKKSNGQNVMIYNNSRPLADLTDYCPPVNGKRYNEVVAGYLSTLGDLSVFDGVSSDGMMEYPGTWCTTDIDLNRNGVNDWSEYGENWIRTVWNNGNIKILQAFKTLNPTKLFFVNSGGFHNYGWTLTHGLFLEHSWALTNWSYFRDQYFKWMGQAPQPHILLLNGKATFRERNRPSRTKNDFQLMRFLLTSCLLGDGYFDFEDVEAGEHFYVKWYDEFDLQLGYPTTGPQKLYVEGPSWNELAVWVRFFQNGVSIVNAKGKPQVITNTDLATLPGYAGPYYRFFGGQDPRFNNGSLFTTATLDGFFVNEALGKIIGDGLILLKAPLKVVSEIILDNNDAGTSPGSEPPTFVGTWTNQKFGGSYTMVEADWMNIYGYASALPGDGSRTVTYVPTIGVPGVYELFEWHGYFGDNPNQTVEATNVPCTLVLGDNRTINLTIDQSVRYSQWNSLGKYYFPAGNTSRIVLSNKANGVVLADAFKLVYRGDQLDNVPPLSPTGLRLEEATDKTLRLSWNAPPAASDGDTIMFYEVYRNEKLAGVTYAPRYFDTKLTENTAYTYKIIGYDDAGNPCPTPLTGTFSTLVDRTPPRITSAWGKGATAVEVYFDEPVDPVTAGNRTNYQISGGVTVLSATLDPTGEKVVLTTTPHVANQRYTLTASNIQDLAAAKNTLLPNTQVEYRASLEPMIITLAVDNQYDLYVNGQWIGSGSNWQVAQRYEVPSIPGKNVIAVKGIDTGGYAGLVAEIEFLGKKYVSNSSWKVSTREETNWASIQFNDLAWQKATSYGLHGPTKPWSNFGNVTNISTTSNVEWIWSADWDNDNTVYFRLVLDTQDDITPPAPPRNVQVRLK